MAEQRFVVTAELPEGVSPADFRDYMRTSIESWSGCYAEDDPLFGHFDNHPIRIQFLASGNKARNDGKNPHTKEAKK